MTFESALASRVDDMVDACTRCGKCVEACPVTEPGRVTDDGLRNNVDVALRYLAAWLGGNGAVGIHNLMEDAATAEISRSQVWQWVHNQTPLDTGEPVTADLVRSVAAEQLAEIAAEVGETAYQAGHFELARRVFEQVALDDDFADFLTLPAYAAAVDSNN